MIADYIDANREEFGVELICKVLQVAPTTEGRSPQSLQETQAGSESAGNQSSPQCHQTPQECSASGP